MSAPSERPRTTKPPPMSPKDYDTLVQSTPAPPPPEASQRDHVTARPGLAVPHAFEGSTDAPAAHRSESFARVANTAPSRRASDPAIVYEISVPRAPLVPALTIPGLRAVSAPPAADLDPTLVLRHGISAREVRGLDLDARAGFVISLVDGVATVEDVCDMCPFGKEDTMMILGLLIARGILAPA